MPLHVKKLDENYTRLLRIVLNTFWKQHEGEVKTNT